MNIEIEKHIATKVNGNFFTYQTGRTKHKKKMKYQIKYNHHKLRLKFENRKKVALFTDSILKTLRIGEFIFCINSTDVHSK